MTDFTERIPAADFDRQIYLKQVVGDEDGDPQLELTAWTGDEETTVRLGMYGVRELRLALARFERRNKQTD